MTKEGHNAEQALRDIANRIMRLMDEKDAIQEDIKEVYAEAKSLGYDTKALRKAIALLRKDPDEVQEEQAMIDLYLSVLRGESPEHAELI